MKQKIRKNNGSLCRNSRLLAAFLAALLCFQLSPQMTVSAAQDGEAAEVLPEGNEDTAEEDGVIRIRNEKDLCELSENCSLNSWSKGRTVVLEADIVLSEESGFLPIPVFSGTFDGGGHTISGFRFADDISRTGFFGTLQKGAVVKQLNIIGQAAPSGDADLIGGIVGLNYGELINCTFEGVIKGNSTVGGIVGYNEKSGRLSGCSFKGTLTGEHYAGGIAGQNEGSIIRCVNSGNINTTAIEVETDPSDLGFDHLISMENVPAGTDIGGIAGFSTGRLQNCKNNGDVGYEHMGYNVGGIAGRQSGNIDGCENSGLIKGRKDVGGIAGQMEPLVTLKYSESIMERIMAEMDSLQGLMSKTLSDMDHISASLTSGVDSIISDTDSIRQNAEDFSEAAEDLRNENIDRLKESVSDLSEKRQEETHELGFHKISDAIDRVQEAAEEVKNAGRSGSQRMDELKDAVSGLHDNISSFHNTVSSSSDTLLNNLHAIDTQTGVIMDLMEEGVEEAENEELSKRFEDISDGEISDISDGQILRAKNTGTVEGDINTAGIVGSLAIEYDFDPEDDLVEEGGRSLDFRCEVSAVVKNCKNEGTVSGKKDHAGGIVGSMELGCVKGCESYGNVSSTGGDYVGGIAGLNRAVIRDCYVKCFLSGGRYIGGVVGMGEEDSRTSGCYTMVEVTEAKQYSGAVSGLETGDFSGNYFVSDELAGLGRLSLSGEAEPISFDTLKAAGGMPEEMTEFSLCFVAEEEEIKREDFEYGASFGEETFPEIPPKEGYYAVWDTKDLTALHFDKIVTAVYSRYVLTLPSTDTRESGRAVFMVDGNFDEDAKLMVSHTEDVTSAGVENALEQWHLQFPDDGQKVHMVRFLPPKEVPEGYDILIHQGGVWNKAECAGFGSYLTFETEGTEVDIIVTTSAASQQILIIAIIGVFLMIVLLVWIGKRRKRTGKEKEKANRDGEKVSEEDQETGQEESVEEERPVKTEETPEEAESGAEETGNIADSKKQKKKRRKRAVPVIVTIVLLCLIAAGILFGEKLQNSLNAYQLLQDFSEQTEYAMEVAIDAKIEEELMHTDVRLFQTEVEGRQITQIRKNDISLFYAEGAIILENGKTYRMNELFPDYSELLDEAAVIYQNADFSATKSGTETVFHIEAEGENAGNLLKIFLPSMAEYISDANRVSVDLTAEEGKLLSVRFASEGSLIDDNHTSYAISAEMKPESTEEGIVIPDKVKETVLSGNIKGQKDISEDLFRLFSAWTDLNEEESFAARLIFSAECGPLSLKNEVRYEQEFEDRQKISCIRKNDLAVYFTDDAVCNKDGLGLSLEEKQIADSTELLDMLYQICLNGEFSCMNTGNNSYLYTLSLEEETMRSLAYTILPEMETMDISLNSGSVQVTVTDETITDIRVDCTGDIAGILSEASVSVSVDMIFMESSGFTIPEAVKNALMK